MFNTVTVLIFMAKLAAGDPVVQAPVTTKATVPVASASLPGVDKNFDYDISDFRYLQAKEVQADLGITEDQRTRMNKHAAWFESEMKVLQSAYAKAREKDPKAPAPNDKLMDDQKEMKRRVLGELSAAQITRLREITLQDAGPMGLLDARVAKIVGLTSDQSKKLKDKITENNKRASELAQKGQNIEQDAIKPLYEKYKGAKPDDKQAQKAFQEDAQKALKPHEKELKGLQDQLNGLREDFDTFVSKTLTDGEKKVFTQLKGKPFKKS